ncbi:MAG: hypothetical protein ACLFPR_02810, partial [Desulfococcaceae bacterium]
MSEFSDIQHEEIARSLVENQISADRNRLYAALARKNGREGLAKLLAAIADAEEVQIRRTRMHLRGKIDGDDLEWIEFLARQKFHAYSREFPRISSDLYQADKKTP